MLKLQGATFKTSAIGLLYPLANAILLIPDPVKCSSEMPSHWPHCASLF